MKKWLCILLAMVVVTLFLSGCAGISKDAKIKCPKCGTIFTVDEGLAEVSKKGY